MNISAINAGSSLNRPQVPRNSVSFGNAVPVAETAQEGAKKAKIALPKVFKTIGSKVATFFKETLPKFFKETVPNFFGGIVAHFKKAPKTEQVEQTVEQTVEANKKFGAKAIDALKGAKTKVVETFKGAKDGIVKFAKEHKGAKGVKLAAAALTAVVAGGFAIKEIYDIATKSNPER